MARAKKKKDVKVEDLGQRIDRLNECIMLNFQRGFWTASAKLSKELLGKNVPKEIVRANQDLLPDKTLVDDIITVQNKARYYLTCNSLPFPFDGVYRIPKHKIVEVEDKLENYYLPMHTERISILASQIKKLERQFAKKYPKYYKPEKYPSKKQLFQKFYIRWTPFYFGLPERSLEVFDSEKYNKQMERIKGTLDEMESLTIAVIGNDLLERLDNLKNKCGEDKVHGKTVGSIGRFIDKWDELWSGTVDDNRMRIIVNQLRRQMKNVTADKIKSSDDFREQVQDKVSGIIKKLERLPNVELKRKIDI